MISVLVDGKWEYINTKGEIVIELQYEHAERFLDGLAVVKIDGKYGYIDETGAMVIQPQFDNADVFRHGHAPVEIDGKWGYIDQTGAVKIEPKYDLAFDFYEGLACVAVGPPLSTQKVAPVALKRAKSTSVTSQLKNGKTSSNGTKPVRSVGIDW